MSGLMHIAHALSCMENYKQKFEGAPMAHSSLIWGVIDTMYYIEVFVLSLSLCIATVSSSITSRAVVEEVKYKRYNAGTYTHGVVAAFI